MSIYQSPQVNVFSQEELAQSEAPTIYASLAVVTFIATVGVVLRFVSRNNSKTKLSYDDYTIVLALVCLYGLNITTVLNAALYGLGRHLPAVDFAIIPSFQKAGLANFILYFTTSFFIKVSLLLLYYRYFGISRPFRLALCLNVGVIVCWYISVFFATIFQCVPVAAFWDRTIKNPRCMPITHFSVGSGITNFLTDVIILCLPMPMVWTLHTNRNQKMILTGIFMLGFFVCAGSIVRITKLVQVNSFDVTWEICDVQIWTSVEPAIGILSACLPTMRPLFGALLNLSSRTATTSKPGSAAKKFIIATESNINPVSPRQDWDFKKLDEEAAIQEIGHVYKSFTAGNRGYGGPARMLHYEMERLEKPLPIRPKDMVMGTG